MLYGVLVWVSPLDSVSTTALSPRTGDAFRTVIWVADGEERKLAEQSRKVMESAEVYGKNRKFLTEILDEKPFTPTPEDGQDLYTTDAKAYEKAIKKSGRARFFEKTYEPVTTTACEERTCGYVYFPFVAASVLAFGRGDGVMGTGRREHAIDARKPTQVLRRERVHGDRVRAMVTCV